MLPISLRPNGRRAVIVGGGTVAARKAALIAGAGFPVFVVAPSINDAARSIAGDSGGTCAQRAYESHDVDEAALVVAATNDDDLNARIVADARAARALVCDAGDPARGDFTMPATQRLGELAIAVDSGGDAPALSRRVAKELAQTLDPDYVDAVRGYARMRAYVKATFGPQQRASILRALAERPIAELAGAPVAAICATRRSELALVQSREVAARLAERGVAASLLGITTTGDRDRKTPIEQLGGVNVFVEELENALREGRADYAVHSAKDLPGSLPDDMRLAAISRREDPRDAFCSERYSNFEALPPGAVVGTSSPRRRALLASLRPDLRYESLRGNVDTRLRKLRAGDYDAVVLAMAGIKRLETGAAHVTPFSLDQLVPAVGQGALAVEIRAGDERFASLLHEAVNDPQSELCVACERAALAAMRAGCSAPLGIHARLDDGTMRVDGAFAGEEGAVMRVRIERVVSSRVQAEALGAEMAGALRSAQAQPAGGKR
jgi:hydroxymethylbilane synthase